MSHSSLQERRLPCSPVRLDGCSCCLNLGNRNGPGSPMESPLDSPMESPLDSPLGFNNNYDPRRPYLGSLRDGGGGGSGSFLQLRENLNAEPLSVAVRQSALDPVLREPYALPRQGLCNRNIDQTLLAILLFFHSASGASVVAIDNKIEQAMDLVKNHLMFAVREEVEVLKEQIKELAEKNSQLERENSLLKNLASPEQLQKFQSRLPLEVQPQPPTPQQQQGLGVPAPAQHAEGSAV